MRRSGSVSKSLALLGLGIPSLLLNACDGSITGASIDEPRILLQTAYCDGPEPDPDCQTGGGGGVGEGYGATVVSYTMPPLRIWGPTVRFPYSLIGTSPWRFEMEVDYVSDEASMLEGEAWWGDRRMATWMVGDGGTWSVPTNGGAGSHSFQMRAVGPLGLITWVRCTNCGRR